MHGRQNRPPSEAWLKISATKLGTFVACPLRGFLDHICPEPAPLNPFAAHGIALHSLFQRFFTKHPSTGRFPYDSVKKFIGAWMAQWLGGVKGEHGFDGMSKDRDQNPVMTVAWPDEELPDRLLKKGIGISAIFHPIHDPIRRDGRHRRTEAGFRTNWAGFYLTGIIDRLDRYADGAVVTDYKSGRYPAHLLASGLQMTFYQLAYDTFFRLQPKWRVPLKDIVIYDYKSGESQSAPLRGSNEFGMLEKYVVEFSTYLQGTLTGEIPKHRRHVEFVHYNERDIERGDISPTLPRGDHCGFCRHLTACLQWELGRRPRARDIFAAAHDPSLGPPFAPRQRPFRHHPQVRAGTARARRIAAQLEAQLSLDLFPPVPGSPEPSAPES